MLGTLFAVFGLILALYNYEVVIFEYDRLGLDVDKYKDASKHPRVTCKISCVTRVLVLLTSIISIVFYCLR